MPCSAQENERERDTSIASILVRHEILSLKIFVEIHPWVSCWWLLTSSFVANKKLIVPHWFLLVEDLSGLKVLFLFIFLVTIEGFPCKIGDICELFDLSYLFYSLDIARFACPFDCVKREKIILFVLLKFVSIFELLSSYLLIHLNCFEITSLS